MGAASEESKRKACKDVLDLIGIGEGEGGRWGIGPTDPEEIAARRRRERNARSLIDSFGF